MKEPSGVIGPPPDTMRHMPIGCIPFSGETMASTLTNIVRCVASENRAVADIPAGRQASVVDRTKSRPSSERRKGNSADFGKRTGGLRPIQIAIVFVVEENFGRTKTNRARTKRQPL